MKGYNESQANDTQAIVDTTDGFRKWKISVDKEDAFWFDAQRRKVNRRIRGKPLKETKAETFHRIRTEYEAIIKLPIVRTVEELNKLLESENPKKQILFLDINGDKK